MEFIDRDALVAEVASLKDQLSGSIKRNIELEEECDLLAEQNVRLQDEVSNLRSELSVSKYSAVESSSTASATATSEPVVVGEVFLESNEPYANTIVRRIANASSGKNVIAVAFFAKKEDDGSQDYLFCGGVDAHLRCYNVTTGEEVCNIKVTAPVLCIDCSPPLVACGVMDGSVVCSSFYPQQGDNSSNNNQLEGKQTFTNHSKYVVGVKWSASGEFLVSAAHDRSFAVYRRGDFQQLTKIAGGELEHLPESLAFLPSEEGFELVMGLRGVSYLLYLSQQLTGEDASQLKQREVSLNEREWDTTSSLTPLALTASPDGRHLLVSTDKSLLLLLKAGTSHRLRVLAGHSCGDYGKPSVSFDSTGSWVYSNSDEDSAVLVFALSSQRVIAKLQGHSGIVRGVTAHPFKKAMVASASYDKSVIIWGSSSGSTAADA